MKPGPKKGTIFKPLKLRFEERFVKTDQCWEWTSRKNAFGYGDFSENASKKWPAHRLSYTLYKGVIPDGMLVLHDCDNPSCVNPDHLRLGTQKDNMVDMFSRGRSGYKITLDVADEIRREYKTKTAKDLAKEYKINIRQVFRIVGGQCWSRKRLMERVLS